jgi:ubiquinone/menaquinone biosynthesis C-methylase UbiE
MRSVTSHPIFARLYARMAPAAEQAGTAAHREELLAGLTGRVVEVGAGSGLCFAHYPETVTEVVAVEPEPHLRMLAERAAGTAHVPVTVLDGMAEDLPLEDGTFDAAVVSLVLCSVADQRAALAAIHRVLKAGGRLRFYEHVRSTEPRLARLQDRVDWIWRRLLGGCHPNRDTEAAIAGAGFCIERCRRFGFQPSVLGTPASPHVIGEARRQ